MKKRLAALLLVLALLLTCVPVGVIAEGTDPAQPLAEGQEETTGEAVVREEHDHKDDAHKCEHCNQFVDWDEWGDDPAEKTTLPTSGHYYLGDHIKVSATTDVKDSAELVLCLNGYTIDAQHTTYIYRVGTNNSTTDKAKVTISDCMAYTDATGEYHAGALMNGKGKDGGGAFFMRGASSLYMFAGKLTGHQNTQTSSSTGYGGGAITSRNTATIYLKNVEISGCSTGTEGGAIGSRDQVTITLEKVTMKNNTATRAGGAIYLDSANNKLTATDCVFENNTTAVTGGAVSARNGEAVLTNCLLKKNTATTDGGAVYLIGANSSMTATDCRFEENTSTQCGGAIAMLEGCSATVIGGAFHKNSATSLGGAIYTNTSDLTVKGTADTYLPLTENHGEAGGNGGAIYMTGDRDVLLQYVSITGNTAATNGGSALMVTGDAQVKLSDAIVTGNRNLTTGTFRGAVYVAGKLSALTLSGRVEIRDNGSADLYVQNNNYNRNNNDCWLTVDGMTEGSEVILHTHTEVKEDENDYLNTRILDGQPASWDKGWIIYSGNQMAVDYDGGQDKFFFTPSHAHCACGDGADTRCDHAQIPYMPWTDSTSLPTSGAIYLKTDVKLPESVLVNGHLQICLNGHTISAEYEEQGNTKDRFFTMNSADQLTISDCQAKTENGVYTAGKLTGSSYTGVMVANSSTSDNTVVVDFYDGIFTGNESSAGAAFSIQDGATLNMYGGEIRGNTSTDKGGAIYVGSNGTFNMYGGQITGNSAVNGAVYVTESTIKLYGGQITGNTVTGLGGGVYLRKSPMTIGGTPVITDNTAGGKASNLYLVGTSQITFDGMGQGEKQIGISADEAPRYLSTDMGAEKPLNYFFADGQFRVVEVKDNRLYLNVTSDHGHCACGDGADTHCDHAQIPYMPWEDATSLPTSGAIYLKTDVKLPESVLVNGHLQICLNGHTISAEYEEQGNSKDRFFTMNSADQLTISDCKAKTENGVYTAGKLTGSSYTGVMVANSSTSDNTVVVDFYDGIFTGNESSAGAAFSIQDGATLNMYGGEIRGNKSTDKGGAVYVGTNGTFHMYGGRITENTAVNGTVYVVDSILKLYGGEISGNTVTGLGGGVYMSRSAVTLGGTPVITGNTAGSSNSNLYLLSTSEISFDGLGAGEQKVGISADEAPRYLSTDMGEEKPLAYFFTDNQYRTLEVKENKLYLNYTSGHSHCDCGGKDSHCNNQQTSWAAWESTTSLPSKDGYYYLLADVTITEYASLSTGHVHLCLNGHTVTAAGTENTKSDRFYTLQKDAKLTITDCTAKTENGVYAAGKLTGATGTAIMILNQTAADVVNNVVVNLYEGIITGNTITGTGGVITVQDKAVFNMYGGEVSGNTAKYAVAADGKTSGGMGAAFYVGEAATLNIYEGAVTGNICEGSGTVYVTGGSAMNLLGGTIAGNKAQENAGAVMVTGKDSVLTVSGGEISENAAKSAGGVLVQVRGTLKLTGGKITGNSATSQGGGVFISTNSTLVMTGGEVTGNTAAGNGGGIALYGATAEISGGKIAGNTAANGGGLAARLGERTVDGKKFTDVPTEVNMTGGEIAGNQASSVGGGVITHGTDTTFTMEGGQISGNEAPNGGGVITQTGSVFNLLDGKITKNTAPKGGSGIYVSYTSIWNMSGGEISNNKTEGNGGGIYTLGAQLNLTGGKISGNYAKGSGAGVYANSHTRFTGKPNEITYTSEINLKGVAVENNTTPGNGAGICTSKRAVVNMSSGAVSGNVAAKAGAGMLLQSGSKLNLTGGTISNNRAKNGAGVYISSDSFMDMRGGSISYNTSTSNCAGLYLLKCEAVLGGGTISHNTSETIAGGIYVVGAQLKLCGTNITDNTAKVNGAGICTTKRTVNGVNYYTNITMTDGTISGNKTEGSGGGVLLQSKTTMTMAGGIVENNRTGKDGGGIYVSTDCTFHMNGGQIRNNTAERNGGGLYNLKSTVNYNAGKIIDNTALGNGGGIVVSGEGYVGNMKKDMIISGNSSVNGGALVVQGRYTLNMEDVNLTDNTATTGNGGAIYLSTNSFLNIKGGTITNHSCDGYGGAIFSTTNSTLNMQGTAVSNNKAGYGGAFSLGGTVALEDLSVLNNEATNEGGGIYCHKLKVGGLFEDHLITVKNTVLENNKAGTQGGGVYVLRGSECLFDGLTVRQNTAGGEGGGLYVVDDAAMYNITVTGNTSGGDGYALYLADSEYDGESYFVGIFKLGGVMVVKDNVGGDMYFGNQTAAAVDHMGLQEGTYMNITLFDGLLTQALQGVYNYEGGDLKYLVTAGDRSVTDPEYDSFWNDLFNPTEPEAPAMGEEELDEIEVMTVNPLIWVVAGAAAVAVAAIAVIIVAVSKKKKTAAGK